MRKMNPDNQPLAVKLHRDGSVQDLAMTAITVYRGAGSKQNAGLKVGRARRSTIIAIRRYADAHDLEYEGTEELLTAVEDHLLGAA